MDRHHTFSKPSGGYDAAWLDGLPALDEAHWVECPHCRGVMFLFAPGMDPRHAPALKYSGTRDRAGNPHPDPERIRLLEDMSCVDCGTRVGDKVGEVFGSSKWWRHGDALPPRRGGQ